MSLAPILSVAGTWTAPGDLGAPGAPRSHFGARALQRGVVSIHGDLLKWAVERALDLGRADLVEFVFAIDADGRLFRIMLPEGLFYPVISPGGTAMTIYCAAQVRRLREVRKSRLRKTGSRIRPVR